MNKNRLRNEGIILCLWLLTQYFLQGNTAASPPQREKTYGEILCQTESFHCQEIETRIVEIENKTKRGIKIIKLTVPQSWESLWPNPEERELIMKINRLNIKLKIDMIIAAPDDLTNKDLLDFSPFEKEIDPPNEKLLIFDPKLLAWGAYESDGKLIRWGPASGGKPGYHTPAREFRIFKKAGPKCRSSKYDAPMPWAMFFHPAGYAFHGSPNVPGKNASHGCVRLFSDDAEWLNKNFVEVGTKVIIKTYPQ